MKRPNVEELLAPLKDFQRETADYIFKRMYLDEDCTHRFLLADEVGLGKTLVARGVIAKTIDHLWDKLDKIKRIDVVYICSNAEIARQNINRLNIVQDNKFTLASRLTLLPLSLTDMKSRSLNFVSFTPATSFDHKSSTGMYQERALLYWLLKEPLEFEGVKAKNVLQGDVSKTDWWRNHLDTFDTENIDAHLAKSFAREIKSSRHKKLRDRFYDLMDVFGNRNHQPTSDERMEQRCVIGEFREILAQTCLNALEPDLIIMDEFQRFRHLLDEDEGEENQIAKSLFNYSDAHTDVRILLMSATPYRMYTLNQEQGEDHYQDFLATYRFLGKSQDKVDEFKLLLDRFRKELFHVQGGNLEALLQAKAGLEMELRKYIVRTERLATGSDRNGMLQQMDGNAPSMKSGDLRSFVMMDRMGDLLDNASILEYWKSAPYLLNFMEGYEIKKQFEGALADKGKKQDVLELIRKYETCVLSQAEISAYGAIDPGNARLRALMRDVFDRGAWKLLWLPPSRPYYQPRGVFADPALRAFTKRLIFSAWNVVPKAVASLMSYEAERRIAQRFNAQLQNNEEDRKRRRALLRFRKTQGREASMPVLALVYPCRFFAERCDPLHMLEKDSGTLPTQDEMLHHLREQIAAGLEKVTVCSTDENRDDERWYWAAPLLLDMAHYRASTVRWMLEGNLATRWNGEQKEEADDDGDGSWGDHVARFREAGQEYVRGVLELGRKPDDLVEVLAQLALAGFGSVAFRALSRVLHDDCFAEVQELRDAAGSVAWSFLSLFNTPESVSLLRGFNREEPFWQRVLEYCADGNLQSVMDEFVHVQHDIQGLIRLSEGETVKKLEALIRSVLSLRAARVGVHDVTRVEKDGLPNLENFGRLRFAARFQKERSEAGSEETRREIVRDAFNSPFWPFVLVSTSIGQEGLDFHCYCHAVVHWNLPTNPVDLEQREGRVHRFKGHAIRKNIAAEHTSVKLNGTRDLWSAMFAQALRDRPAGESDIAPYWMYARPGGAVIERHVPVLPLSRDEERLIDLRKSLAVYRMVFGQSRQEDLLAFLMKQIDATALEEVAEQLKIDLRPGG